jgi:hypothetical protein
MRPSWPRRARLRIPARLRTRAQLRTRVLVSVLAVTLVALAAFDFAAVTALRGYLLRQTDSQLQTVLNPIQGPRLRVLLQQKRKITRHLLPIVGQYYVAFVPGKGQTVIFEQAGSGLVPPIAGGLRVRRAGHAQTVTSDRGTPSCAC